MSSKGSQLQLHDFLKLLVICFGNFIKKFKTKAVPNKAYIFTSTSSI
jgi:hypothetical protein